MDLQYYICPFSGKKLRSKLEVMRFLDEILDCSARSSLVVAGERPERLAKRNRPSTLSLLMADDIPEQLLERDHPATSSLVVPGKRPEWLPEGWSVEFRKRRFSRTIDKVITLASMLDSLLIFVQIESFCSCNKEQLLQ